MNKPVFQALEDGVEYLGKIIIGLLLTVIVLGCVVICKIMGWF